MGVNLRLETSVPVHTPGNNGLVGVAIVEGLAEALLVCILTGGRTGTGGTNARLLAAGRKSVSNAKLPDVELRPADADALLASGAGSLPAGLCNIFRQVSNKMCLTAKVACVTLHCQPKFVSYPIDRGRWRGGRGSRQTSVSSKDAGSAALRLLEGDLACWASDATK